ncbi:unnamed protein product [Vitrella brassicaformis CCMP3155]|uniref:Phytanoyl-CoA dioxygenase n=2 Tax=Vitrella brassicaformis TaxID=1169539 RepID=A0A0G4FRK6_VITBC|nr:unnamed protein product [Vitrella brassicaformis CCMP3155]|eukprot:CEM16732.1 unnamed protein product [Vitrella brassicaformis CCMP3155]
MTIPQGSADPPVVPPDAIAEYQRDGVACLRQLFSTEWIEHLQTAVDEVLRDERNEDLEVYTPKGEAGRFCGEMDCSRKYPAFQHFVLASPAAFIAAQVMRADRCNFFYDFLFVKEPNTAQRTVWHQDLPYWAVHGDQICSIWLPLDPVPQSTCLEFVRGSHKWGKAFAPFRFADGQVYPGMENGLLPRVPDIENNRGDYDILSYDMQLGDCLVFNAKMLHSAPPNASHTLRRRAFSTRWMGEDARFDLPAGEARGYPNFDVALCQGGEMTCKAFPVVWPPSHPDVTKYPVSSSLPKTASLLQPFDGYLELRKRQALKYSQKEQKEMGMH